MGDRPAAPERFHMLMIIHSLAFEMIPRSKKHLFLLLLLPLFHATASFRPPCQRRTVAEKLPLGALTATQQTGTGGDNSAMKFLKQMGRVGGTANRDYRYAIGVDEGSCGKSIGKNGPLSLRKSRASFPSCTATGIVDDLREGFPTTTCGTHWSGFTDQVMGGVSMATLVREQEYYGRTANVLRGKVSLAHNGGFVQMATNLNNDAFASSVDASNFDGVELEVACHSDPAQEEFFNVHLKTTACVRPFSSYRATFAVPTNREWCTVRLPWEHFRGHGPGAIEHPFDPSCLVRAGIVAIGREMDVELGIAGLRFYHQEQH